MDTGERRLVATMPLHAITSAYGEEGLRARFAAEIEVWPEADQRRLNQALALAGRLHAADRREQEPYVNHLLRVAIRIMSHYGVRDGDVVCAALLHDAVEDHAAGLAPAGTRPAALAALAGEFGPRVAALVAAVTNPEYAPGRDADEQYREHVAESLRRDPWARVIKASDFTDNGVGLIHTTGPRLHRLAGKYAPLVPVLQELIALPDTPLDTPARQRILAQLGQAADRFAAILPAGAPTLPPARPPFGGRESHQAREIAESFGSDADRYDRARPRYPDALVDRIVAGIARSQHNPDVLDVGCGTGIVARQFQAAGCRVLGVDPDARMADLARRHGLEVEVSRFEAWHSAGRAFDAVVSGQAWHWVDPVAGAATAARALRPGGRLAVFWNAFQPPPDLAEAFAAVYRRVMPDSPLFRGGAGHAGPDAYQGSCAKAAEGMRQAAAFGEPEQWRFDWDCRYTRDEWLDQLPTSGFWVQIPAAGQREILTGIGTTVDAAGGSFMMHYATVVVTAARTGAA